MNEARRYRAAAALLRDLGWADCGSANARRDDPNTLCLLEAMLAVANDPPEHWSGLKPQHHLVLWDLAKQRLEAVAEDRFGSLGRPTRWLEVVYVLNDGFLLTEQAALSFLEECAREAERREEEALYAAD